MAKGNAGDHQGPPIRTNLSSRGPRPTPRLTARVNPTIRRISPPSSWRRSAGLAPVLGWRGQPSLNPEVGAHGRSLVVALTLPHTSFPLVHGGANRYVVSWQEFRLLPPSV